MSGLRSGSVSTRFLDSELRYEITPSLSARGQSRFSQVVTPVPDQVARGGTFLTQGAGIFLRKSAGSWVLNSSYFLNFGRTHFEQENPSQVLGHSLSSSVAAGDPSSLRGSVGFPIFRKQLLFRVTRDFRIF